MLNVKYMTITNGKILSVQQGEFGTYEEIVGAECQVYDYYKLQDIVGSTG